MAGARVIKVEPPGGENLRRRTAVGGGAIPFAMLNSNKRFVTLNLKQPRGCELLIEMVRRADVLVENFAPGTLDRLGVGFETLRLQNPRLLYASGSGFGLSGHSIPAMDLTVQAMAGVMRSRLSGKSAVKAAPALADFFGGVHLYAALVTALFDRSARIGRLVEVRCRKPCFVIGLEPRPVAGRRRVRDAHRQPSRWTRRVAVQRLPDGRWIHRHPRSAKY
jgi:crotonobetainyl-CoA:carnitine CoA-transferase CaiB-like acyl-CoA transferase